MNPTTHLEQDLDRIRNKIFKMLDLSIESVQDSVSSLRSLNIRVAERIIDKDKSIDLLEKDIDDDCLKTIVTRQPAASDLRFLLAIMKINTDLERIADLSVTIARQTKKIEGQAFVKPLIDIPHMADIIVEMLKDSLDAITDKDSNKAQNVIKRDDILDNLNEQIYRELTTVMAENPRTISQSICLMRVSKSLERMGDHVTNIAEQAVFYIEGHDIRHPNAQ
ncbi:MAG: phosphate signaling complex protein PhoU [Spirochaetota bacterium]